MKRTLLFFLIFLPMLASADAIEIDGIYYKLTEETKVAEVTKNPQQYKGDITIPESVEHEGITYSVTKIGQMAFEDCSSLTSATISSSVTSIEAWAFYGCTSLASITIPNSVTSIGVRAFYNCTSLTSVTIPNSVTTIGTNAFEHCTSLTSVTISNSLTSIGESTFQNCFSLTSVTIPNSVTKIGGLAFRNCSNLASVTIPNSVTEICREAFCNCTSLASISIPNSVTTIERYAFAACDALTSVTIGNGVKIIEGHAFYSCDAVTSVHISDLESLCKISFGDSWSNPLYFAHHFILNGVEVKDLVIPNSVTSIGDYTFYRCSDLASITIPNSVTNIERYAFAYCSGVTSITIGSKVESIGSYAFNECQMISNLYCYAENVPKTQSSAFRNINIGEVTLHVPAASVSAYQATGPWKNFKEIVALAAQDDYHPLIEEGKHWTYDNYMPLRPSEYDHYYYYDLRGDTLIAGQQCLKMYSENLMNNSEIKYQGSLFEENKKVYYFSPGKEKAELLYDFDCFVGDTLHVRAGDLVVKDIQTEDNGGIAIKRYTLYETNDMLDISWIEGVGASTDFFGMMPYPGNYNTLNACELNGEKLYQTIKKDPTEEGYHKMGIEGKRWNYIHYYIDNDGEHFDPYWYVVKGDTIIRRTNYKILYYQDEKTERPVCLLREVGREVFKCDFGDNSYDTPLGTSFFHFGRDDFGRVFSWKAKMEAGNTNWMVYNVDTIKVNNRFFRRYTCLQKYSEEGQALTTIEDGDGVWHDIWVEGIGSASSGIEDQNPNHEPPVRTTSDYTYFVSCYENGECIFTADDFNVQTYTKPDVNIAYRPFVEDGKVWKVGTGTTIVDNSVQVVDYYYFDGDTIIGGKTCKQMMCQRYVSPNYSNEYWTPRPSLTKVGAWYEEDKKVYSFDERQQTMTLKYDFSLEANDTLHFLNVDDFPPFIIGPKQTGGIEGFKGVYRDIMMCRDEGQNIRNTTWLEGVGVRDAPFRNAYDPRADLVPEFLISCTVGDEVIYLNDRYEDGATPESMGARKNRFDFTHTIKTKPKARKRSEEEPLLYGEYNDLKLGINLNPLDDAYQVRITDDSGKVIYEKAVNAGNIVGLNIDISAYAKGRYTVTVENSDESFTGEFNAQGTGIESITSNKVESRPSIYNLQGQRLNSLQKGLNIVNGQKIFVK